MLAPTGEKGTVDYAAVFTVRDGRIATQHVYDPARLPRPSRRYRGCPRDRIGYRIGGFALTYGSSSCRFLNRLCRRGVRPGSIQAGGVTHGSPSSRMRMVQPCLCTLLWWVSQ